MESKKFIADLHIHSRFSRATSKDMNLFNIAKMCEIKGIDLVVTGDITHPQWLNEIKENLVEDSNGLYTLKKNRKVKFILGGEISCIYKKDEKVRKIHNMVYFPDIESAEKFSKKLEKIGNITSDGRPIIGLDAKKLLELSLEINEKVIFIPAHIWTPWFSLFGKMSGFDSIYECFEELTGYIFAVETGLSSDPPMNWKLSQLDRFTLVSNSDAHSPSKIGREANIFECDLNYYSIYEVLKDKKKITTIEFFPEEGKYHYDGHRKCNVVLNPEEAIKLNNLCPVCGNPITIGVLHRVIEIADRKEVIPQQSYISLIPLEEIIAQALGINPSSKKVKNIYDKLIKSLGNELKILQEIPLEDIKKIGGEILAYGIKKMRKGEVEVIPGYDGVYGKIIVINEEERNFLQQKSGIFVEKLNIKKPRKYKKEIKIIKREIIESIENQKVTIRNENQLEAITSLDKYIIVIAGPGTGKTYTLKERINFLLKNNEKPENIFVITFTNKACDELYERIPEKNVNIHTFHTLSKIIIEKFLRRKIKILDGKTQIEIISNLINSKKKSDLDLFLKNLYLHRIGKNIKDFKEEIIQYLEYLEKKEIFDFDRLILKACKIVEEENLNFTISHLLIDEFQDINEIEYNFILHILKTNATLFAIGDPFQSIYGFRGGSNIYFDKIINDLGKVKKIDLKLNYRSCKKILELSHKIIKKRDLFPVRDCDGEINLINFEDDEIEAKFIAKKIKEFVGGFDFHTSKNSKEIISFKDIAILYRISALNKKIKLALKENGIPFQESKDIPLEETENMNFNVEKVNLLSFHASKGLEFKVVFIIGVEEKIIPFNIGKYKTDEEEEKRLLYVALTRAKDKLIITSARRFVFGEIVDNKKSKFLNNLIFKSIKRKKIKTIFS